MAVPPVGRPTAEALVVAYETVTLRVAIGNADEATLAAYAALRAALVGLLTGRPVTLGSVERRLLSEALPGCPLGA